MAVGFPLKTTYANGDVYSASDVNDTNGTINLLGQSVTTSAGKNAVINGGMDIWARGTSFSIAASTGYGSTTFSADRWQTATNANQAITISRQLTNDTTNLPNIQYCARYQRNSGQTGTGALSLVTNFETSNSLRFAGKAVTFSFYARAGANYSAASGSLVSTLYSGTGTDQNIYAYTGTATVAAVTAALTTTWQRFTATGTMSASATELAIAFTFTPVGTAGANDYFEVTGVQVELGSTVTTFARSAPNFGGELAACQRYFYRQGGVTGYNLFGNGYIVTSTKVAASIPFPVIMRTTPVATYLAASNYGFVLTNDTVATATGASSDLLTIYNHRVTFNYSSGGLTAGQGCILLAPNTSSYIDISAEL